MTPMGQEDPRVLGVVLAGGRSSRFGSDKALTEIDGVRLLDRAVTVLGVVCDEVVIASSRPDHSVPGVTRLPDLRADKGPLGGMEAAFAHAREKAIPSVVVLACDLPSVDSSLLRRLIAKLGDAPAVSVGRDDPPGFEPLCAAYRTSCLEPLQELLDDGRFQARALFEKVGGRLLGGSPGGLLNLNEPKDLRAWADRPGTPSRTGPTVVCVIGKKKSGKTSTVVGLVSELVSRGREVVTVKHGHGFALDHEGRDSWRHRHEGGAKRVVMAGPDEFAVVGEWGPQDEGREPSLATLVRRFALDADIVVAEGFKATAFPCIEVYRTAAHPLPLFGDPALGDPHRWLAVLTDERSFRAECPVLDVDAPERFQVLADLVEGVA